MLLVCVQTITPDFLRHCILESIVWRRNRFSRPLRRAACRCSTRCLPTCFSTHFSDYAYLGPRDGQSYNSILERKLPHPDVLDMLSDDEFVITERTIALFHLYVACSLDSGITLKREKAGVYAAHVQTLTKMNGKNGARNWRTELAELLSKWHPVFQGVVKARKGPRLTEDVAQDIHSQVVDASYL